MNQLSVPHWCKPQQELLSRKLQTGALAHAYLISAPNMSGKMALANWLTTTYACQNRGLNSDGMLERCGQCKVCSLINAQTYPDGIVLDKANESISVDSIRTISGFLEKTAQIGQGQFVIINHAQQMTIAAANALLKTLEEPTANTLIILLVENTEHLLPTITSRCQLIPINISPQSLGDAEHLEQFNSLVNVTYLPELQSPELYQLYKDLVAAFVQLISNSGKRAAFLHALSSHERSLIWFERLITSLLRDERQLVKANVLTENELTLISNKLNSDSLQHIFQLTLQLNHKLTALVQANDQMLKEKFVINIAQLIGKLEA